MRRSVLTLILTLLTAFGLSAQPRLWEHIDSSAKGKVAFAFITDLHFSDNGLGSLPLLENMMDSTCVQTVICGGDIVSADSGKDDVLASMETLFQYQDELGQDRFRTLMGKGDYRGKDWNANDVLASEAVAERNFWIDFPEQKARVICLDSGETDMEWLRSKALAVSGYRIIFVSHSSKPLNSTLASLDSGSNEFICHICGDAHSDFSSLEGGLLNITTTCDALYQEDGEGGQEGTFSAQAFDVFTFDFQARSIRAIRVGRGVSRSWKY